MTGLHLRAPLLAAGLLLSALTLAGEDPGDSEIQYLLDFVAASDCTFLRNGNAHEAADAAEHLRLKYRRGKRYADTAENFIDRLASESSWSGEPYRVSCGESTEPTRTWLQRALAGHRAGT